MENYHKHTFYSNISTPDCICSIDDYIKRAKELGHKTISSVEHGFQGNWLEVLSKAKKNDLKFIFGAEAYWCEDDQNDDRGLTGHIILLAKNMNGLRKINLALSNANIKSRFKKRHRIELNDILKLPSNDVFITTACLAFEKGYKDAIKTEDAIVKLYNRFKDNFMLEIQYHMAEKQIEWNNYIKKIHEKYGIKLIVGYDSHYIHEDKAKKRSAYLKAKDIDYPDEHGWFMDYPEDELVFSRFKQQGIFSTEQIQDAMNNTDLLRFFDEINVDDSQFKIPNLYKNLNYNERVSLFKDILNKSWGLVKDSIEKEDRYKYIEAIRNESNVLIDTGFVDYPILNYEIVKKGIENGGHITLTSRGSSSSFYINNLLGFTTIDRLSIPVKLYPERFLSKERLLSGSSPDIDHNVSDPEIFIQAQKDLLGEHSSYYMIAYGTLKEKSAFKAYAKYMNIEFELSNQITSQLEAFEKVKKHTDEEDLEFLSVYDYIDEKYHEIYKESKIFQGIIDSASRHPCAICTFEGDLREEIGLIRVGENICTVSNGKWLEKYKYLKNDWLKVNVVDVIFKCFNEIGIEPIKFNNLLKLTKDDEDVWKIYEDGITMEVNQMETWNGKSKVKKYKPKNISEISAFVAGIRPGFASMLDTFLNRESFEYEIQEIDNLLQDEYMIDSFLLYQEQVMSILIYAGFKKESAYSLIKAIAKKVEGVVDKIEDDFKKNLSEKNISIENIERIWKIVLDNSRYSFNASHSVSVGGDGLYTAYLKSKYPVEFYTVCLRKYSNEKNIKKVSGFRNEIKRFFPYIRLEPMRFGQDNTDYNRHENTIYQSLMSVKEINEKTSEYLKSIKDNKYENFLDLLIDIDTAKDENNKKIINKTKKEVLFTINYFSDFCGNKKLFNFFEYFNYFFKDSKNRKNIIKASISKIPNPCRIDIEAIIKNHSEEKDKSYRIIDNKAIMLDIFQSIKDEQLNIIPQIQAEFELSETILTDFSKEDILLGEVLAVSKKNKSALILSYKTYNSHWCKIIKKLPNPKKNSIIMIHSIEKTDHYGFKINDYSTIIEPKKKK